MDNLREISAGFCGACSGDGTVFRNAFNRAHSGAVAPEAQTAPAQTAGMTLAPHM